MQVGVPRTFPPKVPLFTLKSLFIMMLLIKFVFFIFIAQRINTFQKIVQTCDRRFIFE